VASVVVVVVVVSAEILAVGSHTFVLVVLGLFGVHATSAGTVEFVMFGTQASITSQSVDASARRRTHARLVLALVDVYTSRTNDCVKNETFHQLYVSFARRRTNFSIA